jgi:WhiB family transcriptional regulator, redox-sensing transcriptional regulator
MTAVVLNREVSRARILDDARLPVWWARWAACRGRTAVFFPPHAERPEARARREEEARELCCRCPVLMACREWARTQGEYGFWGGESEEERAAAGFRVELPTGRVAKILHDWRQNQVASPH